MKTDVHCKSHLYQQHLMFVSAETIGKNDLQGKWTLCLFMYCKIVKQSYCIIFFLQL